MPPRIRRRAFLKVSTAAAAGACAAQLIPSWAAAGSTSTKLSNFSYGDVELLPGPLQHQFERNHQFFLNLDEDRLLKVFRQKAGKPAPGDDMGGWYDTSGFDLQHGNFAGFVPGHSLGQYISALSRAYAVTGQSRPGPKFSGWSRAMPKPSIPKPAFLSAIACPHTPTTSCPAA